MYENKQSDYKTDIMLICISIRFSFVNNSIISTLLVL